MSTYSRTRYGLFLPPSYLTPSWSGQHSLPTLSPDDCICQGQWQDLPVPRFRLVLITILFGLCALTTLCILCFVWASWFLFWAIMVFGFPFGSLLLVSQFRRVYRVSQKQHGPEMVHTAASIVAIKLHLAQQTVPFLQTIRVL